MNWNSPNTNINIQEIKLPKRNYVQRVDSSLHQEYIVDGARICCAERANNYRGIERVVKTGVDRVIDSSKTWHPIEG